MNRVWLETMGYTEAELPSLNLWEIIHPESLSHCREISSRVMAGKSVTGFEATFVTKDGSSMVVRRSATGRYSRGRLIATQSFFRDITERKRIEQQLRLASTAMESAANGIMITDREGRIIWVNPAFTRLTGYTPEEALGQNPRLLKSGKHDLSFYQNLWETILSGQTWHSETINRRKDGSLYVEEQTITPVRDERGEISRFISIKQDITERKWAEEALQKRTHDLGERVKELNCLYGISELVEKPDISLEELIQGTVDLIPPAWQYPEITCARIILEGEEFTTENFRETTWKQTSDIVLHGERIGSVEVYYLEEKPESDEGPFLKEERNLLNVIAERLGETIERMRSQKALKEYSERLEDMVEERTRELREAQVQLLAQQRLQQEVELAAQVQTSLLPRGVPSLEGFDFAATALPARYVSGDLYDFTPCGPETCHIVLADIAGKGIPAALLTSTARALVRAETEHDDSPATILSNVNTSLYEDLTHAEVFITFLAARLNARLGTLTYANAGHTETLWWQQASRTCRTLPATGLPLGIDADAPILEETLTLRPGDMLVFYSDGITEAANPHDELFGLDRLIAILSEHAHLPASDLTQAIVEAVEAFRAGAPLSDDLTLIVLKVLPRTISFTYPATLDHLNEVAALVQQVASAYGSDFAYQMELAASEIVTNVIQHAYRTSSGEMRGQITLLPDQIQLDLYDDGAPFDPSQVPASDLTEELQDRGRGLFVARQLTDELTYNPATPEGNHWRLIKLAGSFVRNSPDSPGDDP